MNGWNHLQEQKKKSLSDKSFRLIDGNETKDPVAYCHYRRHPGYMTAGLIKTHGCLRRKCPKLQKLECEYWEERRRRKNMAKMAKRQLENKQI